MSGELLFVYNATSGIPHALMDALHKAIAPQTYACHLCKITYGHFSMKREWKAFLDQLPFPVRFLYREEWRKCYNRKDKLPAIFIRQGENLSVLIESTELTKLNLEELMKALHKRLESIQQAR